MTMTLDEAKQKIDEYAGQSKRSKIELLTFAAVLDCEFDVRLLQDYALSKLGTGKKSYPYTDIGNAERLKSKHGDQFHWVSERKRFVIWNGKIWAWDTPEDIGMLRLAKSTVRDIVQEASSEMDDDIYKKLLAWARQSENEKRLRAMVSLVKAEDGIALGINEFNRNNYLFNVLNGTIDLITGNLKPHDKNDLCTIMVTVEFNKAASCPHWEAFLNQIQSNNQPMIRYLQKLCGYCMTGDTKTQIIPFCHGGGGNGKSTFWTTIRDKIMGEYAHEIAPEVFLISKQHFKDSGLREELANLFGKRMVTATEITENRQVSVNLLKAITGGESITGDRKYEHSVTFKPTFKVILSGNNEPIIRDNTDAAWRRLKKIPFTVKIENPIEGYEHTFDNELSGVLNWMLEGCLLWQKEGLKDPDEVIKATAEYRMNQDVLAEFIEDCCIREVKARTSKKDLKEAYLRWCEDTGNQPLSDKTFKQKIITYGVKDSKSNNERWWAGIMLKAKGTTRPEPGEEEHNNNLGLKGQEGQQIPINPYVKEKSEKVLESCCPSCPSVPDTGLLTPEECRKEVEEI